MSGHRFLKYINIALSIVALAALAVVYWIAWRPLPQTSGVLPAPVDKAGAIVRDERGVPHIQAGSLEDAYFLQGFATAQDRLWQMDASRRLASGELSEIVGKAALESDTEARQLRLRRVAEARYTHMTGEERVAFAAYARGVNFYLDRHRGKLPLEFTLLRYEPRPWTVVDSLVIGVQMLRGLTSSWKDELRKRSMLEAPHADPAKVGRLWPAHPGTGGVVGSNAWVLSGAWTASGKPVLANDPHLEWSNPSTWHMVQLRAPGLDVAGVTVPGLPAVLIGHNRRIAWGITNVGFDVMDFYIEKLDPRTGRYEFRGQLEQAVLERDVIPVRGEKPVEIRTWLTRHGPVLPTEGAARLALKWIAWEPEALRFPFLELDRANNWDEFRAALAQWYAPSSNVVYADVDGNIGYQLTGRLPVRERYTGDVPVDGSSGDFEWTSYIPFDRLPSFSNPPSGMLITANQDPFPPDFPFPVHGKFHPYYRAKQIRDLLSRKRGWRAEEMLGVQRDVYSRAEQLLATRVVAAYDRRNGAASSRLLADAVNLLRNWNGQMQTQQAAPFFAALVMQHVRNTLADKAAPGRGAAYEPEMAPQAVEELLDQRPAGWFADWDDMLLTAASEAADEARRIEGRNPARWDYGDFMQFTFPHPVGQRIPYLGRYFNVGPVAMSGSPTTVKQITRRLGPSMRMVATPDSWDGSLLNITIGESGQILSGHYKDQWDAYYAGRGLPWPFDHVAEKSLLRVQPQ